VDDHPELKAILSFTAVSTRGVYAALKSRSLQKDIHIVGCEQDSDLIDYLSVGEIAAIAAENTYRMGYDAVELIAASWAGKPIPARSVTPPLLITRQNFNSAEARLFTSFPR
jgi:ribose transport system substrate-binding protein